MANDNSNSEERVTDVHSTKVEVANLNSNEKNEAVIIKDAVHKIMRIVDTAISLVIGRRLPVFLLISHQGGDALSISMGDCNCPVNHDAVLKGVEEALGHLRQDNKNIHERQEAQLKEAKELLDRQMDSVSPFYKLLKRALEEAGGNIDQSSVSSEIGNA